MTWALVLAVAAIFVAALVGVAYWLGGLLADAEQFLERVQRGECTCTRHRLCLPCIERIRFERECEEQAA